MYNILKAGDKVTRNKNWLNYMWMSICEKREVNPLKEFTVKSVNGEYSHVCLVEFPDLFWEVANFNKVENKDSLSIESVTYYKRKDKHRDHSWYSYCTSLGIQSYSILTLDKIINPQMVTFKETGDLQLNIELFEQVANPNQHKHLDFIRIFAKNAETSNKPWEGFSFKNQKGEWVSCVGTPDFNESIEYKYCPELPIKCGDRFKLKSDCENVQDKPLHLEVDSNIIVDGLVRVTFSSLGGYFNTNISKENLLRDYEKIT